ncbi:hypothetical protein BDV96DRAFT_645863 [Lophiotrema nucula]|uniref:Uncharacterized protein n=1 Tax=Lophiotrema nucula TaxID=690887 RepID=A0A6A5ZB50_9PLEO|nr:hypothetical protein BDV96DRAFT_645863 [Lophiotrema nucula]
MPGLLGRSRSLRMLRGGHKGTHQREEGSHTPPHANDQFDLERLKAATPVARADSRVETPDMLQRPKTSSGPADRGKLFHKKVAPVTLDSENRTYNFPFPSPSKSTVLYTAEVHEDREEGIIGIALGSPTMASHWNTTPRSTDFVTSNQGTITEITSQNTSPRNIESRQDASRSKLSRWKSIFGKRPQPPHEKPSFYQLAQTVTAARTDSHHDDESVVSMPVSKAESRAGSPPTYKPDIRESRKTLKEIPQAPDRPRAKALADNASGKPRATIIRTVSSPRVPPKDVISNSLRVPQVVVSGSNASSSSSKGLLDVDIPSVHMERYSVMFGNLLQPNNRSSSLLARRHGAERLKPLTELGLKNEDDARNGGLKPQRRATSPSFPKSPSVSLSLFPQPNTRDGRVPSPSRASVHRPRPLQRSKTAPAVSPSRQNFSIAKSANEITEDTHQEPKSAVDSDAGMRTQLLTPTPSSRNSFDEDSEEVTFVVGQAAPWKPRYDEKEPPWEILSKPTNPPPSNLLKSSTSQDRSPLPNPLAAHKPSAPASAPLEPTSRADSKFKTQIEPAPRSADTVAPGAATVGVARSVSVSRANRPEFLKPTLLRAGTDSSERLVDKKPLTPTLVELKNRKSQRVQLVDA